MGDPWCLRGHAHDLAAYGHRTGKALALVMLTTADAPVGSIVEVEIFGHRINATVQAGGAIWDPGNERIRA